MSKKDKVKKIDNEEKVQISLKNVSIIKTKAIGKENGNALVYGIISYPHIDIEDKTAQWFNEYFEKIGQNCCNYVQGELAKNAAVEYEKSQNPRKRFCPRIYNYELDCTVESGDTENKIYITYTAKLYRVYDSLLIEENIRKIIIDLSAMRIIKNN